ncbi:podocan-like protein 1 [Hemitrygon akajei]|uniref:podocan-like protein 1 n=1 Tax=Hemitrygon akajei TaxID=2704970 RepID=UPI003BF99FC1
MKMMNFKGKILVQTLMVVILLLGRSATDLRNAMEGRQAELQISQTLLLSTQAAPKMTRPQKGRGLRASGDLTLIVALGNNKFGVTNEASATSDNKPFPHAPVAQSLNLSNPICTTVPTSLLHKAGQTGSQMFPLQERAGTTQDPDKIEVNLAANLVVNTSLIQARHPTLNYSLSQISKNVPTRVQLGRNTTAKPARRNPPRLSAPKRSGSDPISIHWRRPGAKRVTKVTANHPKYHKLTKPPKKRQKLPPAKLKAKPHVLGKVDQTKREKKPQKNKPLKRKAKPTAFPYFEDYYCPPQCTCYGRVVQCSDKGLKQFPYGIPLSTRNLFLMNNQIDLIPLDLLSEYMLLEFLVLNNNRLTDAGIEGSLKGMPKLAHLYLDQNRLSRVPTDLPLTLEELTLNSNNISSIPTQVWATCENLRTVSLNHNNLRDDSIAPGAFSPMQNILVVKMDHNQLTEVPINFSTNLRELYLEGNQIQKIPNNIVSNSSALIYLNLHDNQLRNKGIGERVFQHLNKLQYLDLGKNVLTVVPKSLPHSLKKLILQDNRITSIRKDTFSNMSYLEEVYLARNQISLVASGAFRSLPRLRHLDLSHNLLIQVPRQLPLTLLYLYLHNNRITYLPRDALCGREWAKSHLVLVRLEKNHLKPWQIDAQALKCLRGYQVIYFE